MFEQYLHRCYIRLSDKNRRRKIGPGEVSSNSSFQVSNEPEKDYVVPKDELQECSRAHAASHLISSPLLLEAAESLLSTPGNQQEIQEYPGYSTAAKVTKL
ncbi:OLC1v1036048C1 [Oldenlandia corymbosa var. corymbosa]|uniref:OLC1v1036048C1 n=1 Tax=Oldenlandia corymbosa var. corymbosa TaxID=529605 RepID=A0AAV1CV03_OLDCO|nr:OLC1v1036048C1 [Oldenlandia corymbosa var. corymbosa]